MVRVLVTGAAGQLGRALLAAIAGTGADARGLGSEEMDITDAGAVAAALAALAPDVVIN